MRVLLGYITGRRWPVQECESAGEYGWGIKLAAEWALLAHPSQPCIGP